MCSQFIVGDYYTGGSLNPARSLGPDVINRDFPGYHWIYWVGPLLGSCVASGFYNFLLFVRWENINPDQDSSDVQTTERKKSTATARSGATMVDPIDHLYEGEQRMERDTLPDENV